MGLRGKKEAGVRAEGRRSRPKRTGRVGEVLGESGGGCHLVP